MTVSETYIVCCAGLNYRFRPVRLQEFRATNTKMMSTLVHSMKENNQYLKQVNGQHLLYLFNDPSIWVLRTMRTNRTNRTNPNPNPKP